MEENTKEKAWEVNFINFVNGLGLECLVGLGKIENPLTKQKEVNPKQVRYIIDTLDMLKEKTEGNLKDDEQKMINELSSYLKMVYVEIQSEIGKKEKEKEREKEEPKDKEQDLGKVEDGSSPDAAEEDKTEREDDK
ncbi:MAG: DUF1844 domain-containing protein [Candidatus Kaelpia aquatica]|nr:DUF1844 domain-containing protein [Candidatus Kaelpia aquatica]